MFRPYTKETQLGNHKLKVPPAQKKREATGEALMFAKIWKEKKHFCENCQDYLGEEPMVNYFSHIKGKGAHPELRLAESNIQILCSDCHYAYDMQGKEAFNARKK